MKTAGAALLIIGLLMTLYTGYTYATREKVLEVGSLELTKENEHTVEWQPYVGIAIAVVGGALFLSSRKGTAAA